jgi:hypothetical protein
MPIKDGQKQFPQTMAIHNLYGKRCAKQNSSFAGQMKKNSAANIIKYFPHLQDK